MTPENLSRSMKTLQANGLAVHGMRLTIMDRARLMAVAASDPLMDGPVVNATTAVLSRHAKPE
jgi:CRP/FNR family transcriptional activator FtrB